MFSKFQQAILVFFCLLLLHSSCESQSNLDRYSIKSFNENVRNSFVSSSRNKINLVSLGVIEQCVVETSIEKYLDSLNNWETIIIDSFVIRNYRIPDISFDFSGVRTPNGKSYTMCLPDLYNYLSTNKYYRFNNGSHQLLDSAKLSVARLNNMELDDFFETQVFIGNNPQQQFVLGSRLIKQIFRNYLFNEIYPEQFMDSIQKEPIDNYNHIMSIVGDHVKRPKYLWPKDYHLSIYDLSPFGYILITYQLDESNKNLDLDMYFVAKKIGYQLMRDIDYRVRYRNCYDKYGK